VTWAYRPYEGKYRIVSFPARDRMAPNMSNTLLKTLEEPPSARCFILLANSPRLLLPHHSFPVPAHSFQPTIHPRRHPNGSRTRRGWTCRGTTSWILCPKEVSEGSGDPRRDPGGPRRELFESSWVAEGLFREKDRLLEALPSQRESLLLILEVMRPLSEIC